MNQLNPTLWRTCRVLSGRIRLDLMRLILDHPGQNVSRLAKQLGIGVSDASQELRRLQSRGLLRRFAQGTAVVYLPLPDPQVPLAAPLLAALKNSLADQRHPPGEIARLAKGLGHEKRVLLTRTLQQHGPMTSAELARVLETSRANLNNHLRILLESGWIGREGRTYSLRPPGHSVMEVLGNSI